MVWCSFESCKFGNVCLQTVEAFVVFVSTKHRAVWLRSKPLQVSPALTDFVKYASSLGTNLYGTYVKPGVIDGSFSFNQ